MREEEDSKTAKALLEEGRVQSVHQAWAWDWASAVSSMMQGGLAEVSPPQDGLSSAMGSCSVQTPTLGGRLASFPILQRRGPVKGHVAGVCALHSWVRQEQPSNRHAGHPHGVWLCLVQTAVACVGSH